MSRCALVPAAVLAVVALVLGGCSVKDGGEKKAAVLPDATLQSFGTGSAIDLSTLRGPAVINLWASYCVHCRRELPLYQAYAKKYAGQVKVLGVDFKETRDQSAKAMIEKAGVTYPLYADPDGRLRAIGLPQVILVDAKGRITFKDYVEVTSVAQLEKLARDHLDVS